MSARAPHQTVKHELLVRYLDAWTPAALHGHKRAMYVSWAGHTSAKTALRVFAEFEDILERHMLTMVIPPDVAVAELVPVPGVVVNAGPPTPQAKNVPVLGWFDRPDAGPLSTVAGCALAEVIVAAPAPAPDALLAAVVPLPLRCRVELVDAGGRGELLLFATTSERSLERFKEELWALDEYAGIRLRDPADADGALSDIAAVALLGPLRRTLLRRLAGTDGLTVAQLRAFTLHETMFRAADATRAVQALVSAGSVSREPSAGRLSAETVIRPL